MTPKLVTTTARLVADLVEHERIIQVTSIAGHIGPAGRAPYAAAKFGVEGFSESLLKEIGPLGIKVTIN